MKLILTKEDDKKDENKACLLKNVCMDNRVILIVAFSGSVVRDV